MATSTIVGCRRITRPAGPTIQEVMRPVATATDIALATALTIVPRVSLSTSGLVDIVADTAVVVTAADQK